MSFSSNFYGEYYLKTHIPVYSEEFNQMETDFFIKILDLDNNARILEMPCGYGRHSIKFAEHGFIVTAIDNNQEFINLAENKSENIENVSFVLQDMRNIDYEQIFDAVLFPSTGFGYFSDSDNFELLKNSAKAIKKKGKLLIDSLNREKMVSYNQEIMQSWLIYPDNMALMANNTFDIFTNIWKSKQLIADNNELIPQDLQIRLYSYTELKFLLSECGMDIVDVYGSREAGVYNRDSEYMTIIAVKN